MKSARPLHVALLACGAVLLALGLSPRPAAAQSDTRTDAWKIANAMSAGPASIADEAAIKTHQGEVLREGTNGWTCYPDMPDLAGQNPMCLDQEWVDFMDAYRNKREPNVTQIGTAYMLQGGSPGSNTDPYAEGPTPDNEWSEEGWGPHLMIIVPDMTMYEDLPTSPDNGGPWVMFANTPYAHIMVPTAGK